MRSIVPIARLLLVALFLFSAPNHFKAQTIAYAAQQGVPFASILVPLSGLLALAGGQSRRRGRLRVSRNAQRVDFSMTSRDEVLPVRSGNGCRTLSSAADCDARIVPPPPGTFLLKGK